jgi:hypothetical protein
MRNFSAISLTTFIYCKSDGDSESLRKKQNLLDESIFIDFIVDSFQLGTLADLISTL